MELTKIIIMLILAILGAFLGYFGIWFFNRMPEKWLMDYGEEPGEEVDQDYQQRIKSYPWKFVMVAFMVLCAVKLSFGDSYIAVSSLIAIWALMLMAVADKKYMIIPDQLIVILLVSAIGFIPHYITWKEPLFGGLVAFAVMGLIALLGKIVYKRFVIGGGDVKLYFAIGIIFGWKGFLSIFILATLLSAVRFGYLLLNKKAKKDEEKPLAPYIFGATCVYLLILFPYVGEIWL